MSISQANKSWLDGHLVDSQAGMIPLSDRSLLLGDGVFETVLIRNRCILNWNQHAERLEKSLKLAGIPRIYSRDELLEGIRSMMDAASLDCASVRLTVTRGSGSKGYLPLPDDQVQPRTLISAKPLATTDTSGQTCIRAVSCPNPIFSRDPLQRIKSTSRLQYVLAARFARDSGVEECLMLNESGVIAEWTSGNFLILDEKEGILSTPDDSSGALAGITRETALLAATRSGLRPERTEILPDGLKTTQCLLLTNSLRGIQVVSELDGKVFHRGSVPLEKLQTALADIRMESSVPL